MHTSYAPEELTEDYIENCCEDLRGILINVMRNDGAEQEQEYDHACQQINHISAMLDAMMPEEE